MFFIFILLFLTIESGELQSPTLKDSFSISKSPEEKAKTALQIAKHYYALDLDTALIYAKNAIQYAQESNETNFCADAQLLVGEILEKKANFDLAIEYFQNALDNYRNINNISGISKTLNYLSKTNANAEFYEIAIDYINEAIDISRNLNDSATLIENYFTLAYAFERYDKPEQSLTYLKLCDSLNHDPGMKIRINEGFASIYEDLGKYDEARANYQNVLSNLNRGVEYIDALNNIGDTYRKTKEFELAIPYYQLGLDQSYEINYGKGKIQCHLDIALAYEGIGNYEKALEHFKKHNKLYTESFNTEIANNVNTLNLLYNIEKDNSKLELEQTKANNRTKQRNILFIVAIIGFLIAVYLFYLLKRLNKNKHEVLIQNEKLLKQKSELEETQALLVQSEKMASIGTFTAGIAHEINNPLNFIANGINLIKDASIPSSSLSEAEKQENLVLAREIIGQGFERAKKILQALLTFSYPSDSKNSKKQIVKINDIVENTLLLIKSSIPEKIEVRLSLKAKKVISAYPEKLHQVLLNIITNAVDELNIKDENNFIEIKTFDKEDRQYLTIYNSGSNIDPQTIQHIFDPFFTTKEQGKGSGLGLWITYSLIKEHDGSIQASNLNNGVQFEISLPIKKSEIT